MNIKELRKKYGMSQQDLSDKTGIPKGRINGWEQFGSRPKVPDEAILRTFFDALEGKNKKTVDLESALKEEIRLLKQTLADKEEIISLLRDKVALMAKQKIA